jgi:micrococcal nuclease
MRRGWLLIFGFTVACTASPVVPESDTPTPEPSEAATPESAEPTFGPTGQVEEAMVVSVTDGDTIRVTIDGVEYPVRYIGIDAPETVDPNSPVAWMGEEASAANALLVADRTVTLEKDVSETDSFGRLLRYVWLSTDTGWLLINEELVRRGFASASPYPPDVNHQFLLELAEREARSDEVGLWGPTPTPATVAPTPTPVPPVAPPPATNCDPSYPTVCIPPYPPDLDCGDITFRRFQVLPPDPHGFDGNHDGVGCEGG